MSSTFDGVVLGGGKSRRMGTNKVLLEVEGKALLRTGVEALAGARKIALVAPPEVCEQAFPKGLPGNVVQVLEDPPDGGPVAGIQAGLVALAAPLPAPPALIVGIVAADHPRAPAAIHALRDAGALDPPAGIDGVCAVNPEGVPQWLLGFYRREYILKRLDKAFAGSGRDRSVRSLFAAAALELIPMDRQDTLDLDSPADIAEYAGAKTDASRVSPAALAMPRALETPDRSESR